MSSSVRSDSVWAPALLLACVALLYGHTLHVPFYLDDTPLLLETARLRDLGEAATHLFSQRGLSNFTFALNYQFAGWALPALHLVNIALHAVCGVLVWLFLRRVLPGHWLPLGGALLFIAHPLQTQAVTYLAQRSTVLAADLFLLAVLCHLKVRSLWSATGGSGARAVRCWHFATLLLAGCAVLAKENTATLPLVLLAYDRLFPPAAIPGRRQVLGYYLSFCVVPLLLAVATLYPMLANSGTAAFQSELVSLRHNDPLHYLFTQFSVFWVYLRLLLVPVGQALLHNYPVTEHLLNWQNLVALTGLGLLLWLAWRIRQRRPLLTFGVAWFFLTLAIESSIIPLDPLFEHRLYLPMVGFILVLLDGLPTALNPRMLAVFLVTALLAGGVLTWRRNALWIDPTAFYEDNLRKAPQSERLLEYLGMRYAAAGEFPRALTYLQRALELNPRDASVSTNLGVIHAWMGDHRRAAEYYEQSLQLAPQSGKTLFNYAATIYSLGDKAQALAMLKASVQFAPDNRDAQYGLGALALELGQPQLVAAARDALIRLGDLERARDLGPLPDMPTPEKNR